MIVYPNCKINVGLRIVERRPDGYHNLETIFYPIPLYDNLEFKELPPADAPYRFSLGGIPLDGSPDDNLVVRVFRAMQQEFSLPPLDIFLYKHIPTGAGLGGGSSDAAAMMTALNEAYDLRLTTADMQRRMAAFGADCAFFVTAKPALATGIGDQLSPTALSLKGRHILLVKPDVHVSTKEAYAHVVPRAGGPSLEELVKSPIREWRDAVVNDFEPSVFAAHPQLAAIKQTLYDMGALYAAMSGSGSTMFGIFDRPTPEASKVFADAFVFHKKLLK